ncbi:DUF4173 domain-containing protein [Emticicia sp. C21]|uniref:DUF4153 domain-containing protein n=1 Tax=Emticicia sp. C21 TaxID=2302915 RepID=UPI000E3457E5|nr:DUF4173 domain-containing protein [Emticicia sp. C21]RFS15229.1 DUF4173 domain-containing protein [Emticicia sp. C21]
MSSTNLKVLALALLTILFNYFFWEEKVGINLPLFSSLLIGSLIYSDKIKLDSLAIKVALGLTIFTGILVVIHNSVISVFTHFFSFIVLVGFLHRPQLTSVSSAMFQFGVNALMSTFEPIILLASTNNHRNRNTSKFNWVFRITKLLIIPVVVFFIFLSIFKAANPIFSNMLDTTFSGFFQAFNQFFYSLSLPHLIFILFGAFIIICVLKNWERAKGIHKLFQFQSPKILQSPENLNETNAKNEYKTALILICSVNVLLLIINIIDIRFIWFNVGGDLKSAVELSQLVHNGTYLLIFSILLSIAILLFYFRKDLNFLSDNKWLITASYIWIIQNGILVISVLLRNYEYIINYGLTHKRIGVFFFLLLTSAGLVLMWLKIKKLYSFLHLFKQAGWVFYIAFISLAIFDWDSMIARYNLSTQSAANIDYKYLYDLSNRTLPILYENKEKIIERIKQKPAMDHEKEINKLNNKIKRYLSEQQGYTWVSWDLSNSKAVDYFKDKKLEDYTPPVTKNQ